MTFFSRRTLSRIFGAVIVVMTCIPLGSSSLCAQTTDPAGAEPQLAIATLKFIRTNGNPEVCIGKFQVIQTTKVVKAPHVHAEHLTYHCRIADDAGRILHSIDLEDPLKPRYEYPDEDGVLQWVILPQDTNEVLIRFPFSAEMKSLQIISSGERHQTDLICTIPLPKTTE
jgi:hypothetical protein